MTASDSTAVHEASHLAAAAVFGWRLLGASVRPGAWSNGCSRAVAPPVAEEVWERGLAAVTAGRPLAAWPWPVHAAIEERIIVLLAGETGALQARALLSPAAPPARTGDPPAERAAVIAADLPEPTPGMLAELAGFADDEHADWDDVAAARLARLACGPDLASAAALLAWCGAQARALVMREAEAIARLADALLLREVLSGEAAAAVLQGARADR